MGQPDGEELRGAAPDDGGQARTALILIGGGHHQGAGQAAARQAGRGVPLCLAGGAGDHVALRAVAVWTELPPESFDFFLKRLNVRGPGIAFTSRLSAKRSADPI